MASKKKENWAGGVGILAAAVYLCVKGLRQVDARIRERSGKKKT